HAGGPRPPDLLERVEHDERPGCGGAPQLRIRLVVSVEDDSVTRKPCALGEFELARGGHGRAEARRGKQPQQRDAREGLRPVDDERVGVHARIRARTRENRIPAVDEQRRAELRRERRRANASDHELAVFEGGRVWKQLDQRIATYVSDPPRSCRSVISDWRRAQPRALMAGAAQRAPPSLPQSPPTSAL